VVPRNEAAQASAKQDRDQYTQWWITAETQAYYADLKNRMKVEILAPSPPKRCRILSVVAVAQSVESRIVIPVVVGSSPISHPNRFKGSLL
jgi:hypothetical protein